MLKRTMAVSALICSSLKDPDPDAEDKEEEEVEDFQC
jgi:hypothetical protein